jgi:hypothetical protein
MEVLRLMPSCERIGRRQGGIAHEHLTWARPGRDEHRNVRRKAKARDLRLRVDSDLAWGHLRTLWHVMGASLCPAGGAGAKRQGAVR